MEDKHSELIKLLTEQAVLLRLRNNIDKDIARVELEIIKLEQNGN